MTTYRILVALGAVLSCLGWTTAICAASSGKILKEIRLNELRYTKKEIVLRELVSRVGEPYLERYADEDRERLDRLGIFSSIDIRPTEETDGVVLHIDVKETFPYLPLVSMEVTDENGLSIGPGFRSVNLFRRAIAFSAAARFGGATNIDVNIRDPWFAGDHLSYEVQFNQWDRVNELDEFNELSTGVKVRLGGYLGEDGRIGGQFGFLSLGSDVEGVTLSSTNRDNIPAFGVFLGLDTRDEVTDSHRGWWNELEVMKSGGDGNYWTFNFDVRRYQPLATKHTLVLFSLLTLQTGRVGEDIPIYRDFHIGGTNTVRGWGLAARNGKDQFLGTFEYRYALMDVRPLTPFGFNLHFGIQLAAFADLGSAWNETITRDDFIDGYGIGVRFLVPFVNMVRLDFGFGEPGGGVRFHVALFEKAVMQRARVR